MIETGKKLGNYLINDKIGNGGMGSIYSAIDTMLNRQVALKIIHPELIKNHQLMETFKTEARMHAQLNHPNIVTVFSFEIIGDDYIIILEFVDGQSLSAMIQKDGPFKIKAAIQYFKQILRGLNYAHSLNIIHRDIKPANILVTKRGQVKLSDFGIAKIFGTWESSRSGFVMGTPCYSSPELLSGAEIDFRTDIYSVGITFYEMLTGEPPFCGNEYTDAKIQKMQIYDTPQLASKYNPHIMRELDEFILRTLKKKPEERFQTAIEMLTELDKIEGLQTNG